jgi:hypothetical protein
MWPVVGPLRDQLRDTEGYSGQIHKLSPFSFPSFPFLFFGHSATLYPEPKKKQGLSFAEFGHTRRLQKRERLSSSRLHTG